MSAARPRLLFVGAFPPPGQEVYGGNVTACRALLRSSFRDAFQLDLLDSTQPTNPAPRFLSRLLRAARRCVVFVSRVEQNRPDAVLLFVAAGASVAEKGAMAWYARLRRVPVVVFPRGGPLLDACSNSRLQRTWARLAFGGASKVFCQGDRWQRLAVEVLNRSEAEAPVIPNWGATPDLLALGNRRERMTRGRVPILFLGWLEREKGVEELLEACKRLIPRHDFLLSVGGEGHYSAQARELVRSGGLSDHVEFTGWLDDQGVREALARNEILVLPSWSEGLPNVVIEAMAARLAVIATRVGTIPDYVADGEHALLVEPRDSEALAQAMGRLIADADLRERIAHAGRDMAATRFNVETAVDLMLAELSELADGSRTPRHGRRMAS